MKKILSFIIIASLIVSVLYGGFFLPDVGRVEAETLPCFVVNQVSCSAGATIDLYVGIKNNPGIISMRFKVVFDAYNFELIGVSDLGLLSGFTNPSPDHVSPYTLRWADALSTENNTSDGDLVKLTFKVNEIILPGTYSVSVSPVEARNTLGSKVSFREAEAIINVTDRIIGDADGDGEITDWDSIVFERYLAGWDIDNIDLSVLDIDADGEVTDWDSILLSRYLAGWEVTIDPSSTPVPVILPLDEAYDIETSYPITTREVSAINPQNYAAVDGLGRVLSTSGDTYKSSLLSGEVASDKDPEKFVGIFYSSWHEELGRQNSVRNVTAILNSLKTDEEREAAKHNFYDPVWNNITGYHFWDEPIYNYYSTADRYVIRKQAELLADAGIDCIILDNTNGRFTWEKSYMALFKGFSEARQQGVNAPGIVFMLNFAAGEDARYQLEDIYTKLYKNELYKDTWFYWKGKPLILAYSESLDTSGSALDREIYNFFTFRKNDPSYFHDNLSNTYWGWLSIFPQCVYTNSDGTVEEITVGVAQNADYERNVITAMSGYNVMGRSYTKGLYNYTYKLNGKNVKVDKNIEDSKFYGLNFQQQWDYAIKRDPEFIFVTGWNEWVAMRMETWAGDTTLQNTMVDQFDTEYSRDCEPSLGVMKDYYYYQLCENVRRFKGVNNTAEVSPKKTIDVYGKLSQWNDVPETLTYVGSTMTRSNANGSKGYGGKIYRNTTARNDIAAVKTAYDDNYIYFYGECANEITSWDDSGWMRLFIDIDTANTTNAWEGFEFVINRVNPADNTAVVERSTGGWDWQYCGSADIIVRKNIIQIRVQRNVLGLGKGGVPQSFGYKWTDNNLTGANEGNILNLYTDGEAAPGGRFCFVFKGE